MIGTIHTSASRTSLHVRFATTPHSCLYTSLQEESARVQINACMFLDTLLPLLTCGKELKTLSFELEEKLYNLHQRMND